MEIYDLFKSFQSNIPRTWAGADFYDAVSKDFKDFYAELSKVDLSIDGFSIDLEQTFIKSEVFDLQNEVLQAIAHYLDGYPSEAFLSLEKSLNSRFAILRNLFSKELDIDTYKFYRVRESGTFPLTRENIFHAPISKRNGVRSNRYSIPGFPSLYLGTSLYISTIENKLLDLSKLIASKFKLRKPIRALNFGYNNVIIDELLDKVKSGGLSQPPIINQQLIDFAKAHIVFFPLMMASAYIVQAPNLGFKPEYIIPQLLLQYVRKSRKDIHGIRYLSTHASPTLGFTKQLNFVFPIQDFKGVEHCTWLRSHFELTNPFEIKSLERISKIVPG